MTSLLVCVAKPMSLSVIVLSVRAANRQCGCTDVAARTAGLTFRAQTRRLDPCRRASSGLAEQLRLPSQSLLVSVRY